MAQKLYCVKHNDCLKHATIKKNIKGRETINKHMGIKTGQKRIAISTGKPDRRQRDNKKTPGNTPSLKPHHHKPGD